MVSDRDLRARLVAHLERTGVLTSPSVARTMLAVPRHRFIPTAPVEAAYDDRALAIKEQNGNVLSSISQPSMVAQMLQLLDVEPGTRVLEIGTGSGYNAALLASLTGPEGSVVTVEIEQDLLEESRARLAELDFQNIDVMHADQLPLVQEQFSRIVVTARADDVEPEWWRLLEDAGRIVVPLSLGVGGERAFGLTREGDLLYSFGSHPCAFIGLRNGDEERSGDMFFLNRNARYATRGAGSQQLHVVAMRRQAPRTDLLEQADAVIARPTSIFAITIEAATHNR
jgi:protein-L-isoaspartate(D-aspartate) O-methyltransferase